MLVKVANYCSGSLISSYDYDVDAQDHGLDAGGRRTKVAYGGSAFNIDYGKEEDTGDWKCDCPKVYYMHTDEYHPPLGPWA